MRIQEQIKQDLKQAMKDKDEEKKNTLRIIIGEFGRAAAKELSDEEVIKIVRKLIKSVHSTCRRWPRMRKSAIGLPIISTFPNTKTKCRQCEISWRTSAPARTAI